MPFDGRDNFPQASRPRPHQDLRVTKPVSWRRWLYGATAVSVLLAGCGDRSQPGPEASRPAPAVARPVPTYAPARWDELPATDDHELLAGFLAWRSACQPRLARDPVWAGPCQAALQLPAEASAVRRFLTSQLDLYRLQTPAGPVGLITGYYEPVYPGRLQPDAHHQIPVYGVPEDMIVVALDGQYPDLRGRRLRGRIEGRTLKPYEDAATIRTRGVRAPVLAWLQDPMDLQFLQVQGSGRIRLADGHQLRLGYADQNGHPYRPVGRWLIEQGELAKDDVSMQRIRDWARAHPERVSALLDSNPSYVFFSLRPDSPEGPRGSLNVPLTAGYSVAIDRRVIPLGSLLWLASSRPDGQPLARPVAAQDTGGAISGEVRADLFWGTGEAAGELAGAMKQPGQLWLLWPRGIALPEAPPSA